jgi:hypothetical protein
MTYWVEIRAGKSRSGKIRLVPLADVYNHTGFRSVFAYDDITADLIRDANSTAGLRGHEVYCDTLFMDFDDHNPDQFRHWLANSGLGYSEWHSGGRSVHFHIPVNPVFGVWVPGACKSWVCEHAPTADRSFYNTSGMYRLPGTFHNNYPGQLKHRLSNHAGHQLTLVRPAAQEITYRTTPATSTDFWVMLQSHKGVGERTIYLWLLATTAAEAGLHIDEAITQIQLWNQHFTTAAHPADYVERKVQEAYRRHYGT